MKEIKIDIILEVSLNLGLHEILIVPAIAICNILDDRVQEEYGDEVKTTILPYYRIKEIEFKEEDYNYRQLLIIYQYIENYWLDIEDSIN